MKRLLMGRKFIFAVVVAAIFSLFTTTPVKAFEQSAKSRILSLKRDKTIGRLVTYTLKTTGPLNLPKYPFTLSKPNRIVLDFYGALPGNRLASTCRKAASQQITIRSGHHNHFTRIVLDFGKKTLPNHRLSQKLGFVTITLEYPPAIKMKPEDTQDLSLEDAPPTDSDTDKAIHDEVEPEKDAEAPDPFSPQDNVFAQEGVDIGDDAETDSMFDEEFEIAAEGEKPENAYHFSGSVKNKYFRDVDEENTFENDAFNHFETIVKLTYDSDGIFSAELGVDVDAYAEENEGDYSYDNDLRFYETYANLSFSELNIRLGNQIVRWGKSDGNSPIDNVNPEDLRSGIAGRREERKVPIPMANIEYDLNGTIFQAIYIPGFYKSDFDIVGTDWALFGHSDQTAGPFLYQEEGSQELFDNPEYGLRFSSTIRNFDFALSYLHTRTDTPVIGSMTVPVGFPLDLESGSLRDIVPFAIATNQIIPIKYERQNIFSFEFETTISDFGVRGDAAYFDEAGYLSDDLDQIKKPMVQYVLGADYISPLDFYINLQFSHAIILDYENTLLHQKENMYALSGTISQELMNGELKLELRGYYDLSGDAAMYNPQIIIKPWDNVSLELGAEIFSGTQQTLLGLFKENDQYYGMVKFAF